MKSFSREAARRQNNVNIKHYISLTVAWTIHWPMHCIVITSSLKIIQIILIFRKYKCQNFMPSLLNPENLIVVLYTFPKFRTRFCNWLVSFTMSLYISFVASWSFRIALFNFQSFYEFICFFFLCCNVKLQRSVSAPNLLKFCSFTLPHYICGQFLLPIFVFIFSGKLYNIYILTQTYTIITL